MGRVAVTGNGHVEDIARRERHYWIPASCVAAIEDDVLGVVTRKAVRCISESPAKVVITVTRLEGEAGEAGDHGVTSSTMQPASRPLARSLSRSSLVRSFIAGLLREERCGRPRPDRKDRRAGAAARSDCGRPCNPCGLCRCGSGCRCPSLWLAATSAHRDFHGGG